MYIMFIYAMYRELYINETTLSVSLDPSNVLCVSFNTRDGEAEQGFYYKQQNYLRPKEEIEQDYHNQEMFQQATGEESEEGKEDNGDDEDEVEQLNQQNIHKQNNPSAVSLALSSNNIQGICQQIWQDKRKEKETEQTQQQQSKKGQWKIEQKTTRNVVFSSNVEQLQGVCMCVYSDSLYSQVLIFSRELVSLLYLWLFDPLIPHQKKEWHPTQYT